MAYEDRSYSGNAVPTTLTANISPSDATIPIASATGWPDGTSGPFHIGIAPAGTSAYTEVIRCTGRTGLNLNATGGRGIDGTVAQSHLVGATVHHVFTATDADEANQHYSNTGLDHHTQYLNVVRHDQSARHGIGVLPVGGTPSTSAVGDTSQTGSSGLLARSDHKHAREGWGSPSSAGVANADGTAVTVPRSDHVHAGGVPVLATAPSSPSIGQTYIDATTFRIMTWDGSAWSRGSHFRSAGRTGVYIGRLNSYPIPDAGASTHIIPYDEKPIDSDSFAPTPNGTTTNTITVPAGVEGIYIAFVQLVWSTLITSRAYVEILHGIGPDLYQFRSNTRDEDRGSITAVVSLFAGHTIQMGAWQNSGATVNVQGYMFLYRLFR